MRLRELNNPQELKISLCLLPAGRKLQLLVLQPCRRVPAVPWLVMVLLT